MIRSKIQQNVEQKSMKLKIVQEVISEAKSWFLEKFNNIDVLAAAN